MDDNTLTIELPDSLREFVGERVRQGDYTSEAEYLRDLVRRDREQRAAARLRELIQEGLASGPPREMTEDDWAELRKLALKRRA